MSDDSYYDENEKLDVLCINKKEQDDRNVTFTIDNEESLAAVQ